MHQRILILDYGSQVTQLIARRVREAGVYCELHPGDVSADFLQKQLGLGLKGIILSGSHGSAYDEDSLKVPETVFSLGVPVLGICYGMQAMAQQLGGAVSHADHREFGYAEVRARGHTSLLKDIQDFVTAEGHGMLKVWMSHGDQVTKLPDGFKVMASTDSCPIAGMADEARRFYAVQFHPEVTHTIQGQALLNRFVSDICACTGDWTMPNYVDEAIARIREQVGQDEVILGLSGGVDSSVAAALIHRAIGDRLTCVFVDHGLLRKDEAAEVQANFARLGVPIETVYCADRFLGALAGETDPEKKRKIIGNLFLDVFWDAIGEEVELFAQGTLYPDVIESASSGSIASKIKTHHNRVDRILDLQKEGRVLEPLADLFKDEVRALGAVLGIDHDILWRHPFPGPGLAVRCPGEVTEEKLRIIRECDAIYMERLRATGWYEKVWQAYAALIPVKTVGVKGDERSYEWAISIRAVTSEDAMTADWARMPFEVLASISNEILNNVKGINRVLYDISTKPPASIEWE